MKRQSVKAGSKTDALVTEWVEPKPTHGLVGVCGDLPRYSPEKWWILRFKGWEPSKQPSTNHAHAVEAILQGPLKVSTWHLTSVGDVLVTCTIVVVGQKCSQSCECVETGGDEGKAISLAICRAILAAMKAEEAKKEN